MSVPVAVVADVFLAALSCARAKTPAFATGPFDALDAVVPARLAEAAELELVPRAEGGPDPIPSPRNFWPAPDATPEARLTAGAGRLGGRHDDDFSRRQPGAAGRARRRDRTRPRCCWHG